ncbi:MAG TPA: hypothetical protein VF401_01495 [Candidatus Saccharimonadales bacterium]
MNEHEARMLRQAEDRRRESEAIDPERFKQFSMLQTVVEPPPQIPNFDNEITRAYRERAEQIVADDPDVERHQALAPNRNAADKAA